MVRVALALLLVACSGGAVDSPVPVEPPPVEPPPVEPVVAKLEVPAGAKVVFVSPADGATVKSPVHVVMGVEGIEVKPAGDLTAGTGHHHLIVNGSHIENGVVVPKDETHIHFGQGQTEADVELKPGSYTLTLQFADGTHTSFGEPLSSTIRVTVE